MPVFRYETKDAIASGDAISPDIGNAYERHYISFTFFTDDTYAVEVDPATMTGTIDVEASETGTVYGVATNSPITLGAAYPRPNLASSVKKIKATFNTVVGATHYKMLVSSFAG